MMKVGQRGQDPHKRQLGGSLLHVPKAKVHSVQRKAVAMGKKGEKKKKKKTCSHIF